MNIRSFQTRSKRNFGGLCAHETNLAHVHIFHNEAEAIVFIATVKNSRMQTGILIISYVRCDRALALPRAIFLVSKGNCILVCNFAGFAANDVRSRQAATGM